MWMYFYKAKKSTFSRQRSTPTTQRSVTKDGNVGVNLSLGPQKSGRVGLPA